MEGLLRNHVHPSAQEGLELVDEGGAVDERGSGIAIHEQIDIAARGRRRASYRAEHSDVAESVAPDGRQDRFAARE